LARFALQWLELFLKAGHRGVAEFVQTQRREGFLFHQGAKKPKSMAADKAMRAEQAAKMRRWIHMSPEEQQAKLQYWIAAGMDRASPWRTISGWED
jgi:hypothetical protein